MVWISWAGMRPFMTALAVSTLLRAGNADEGLVHGINLTINGTAAGLRNRG